MIDFINVANTFTQDGSTTRIVRADGQERSREHFDFYFFIQRHNESEGYRGGQASQTDSRVPHKFPRS